MVLNKFPFFSLCVNNIANNRYTVMHLLASLLLLIALAASAFPSMAQEKSYLRFEKSKNLDEEDPLNIPDLDITSLGGLVFSEDKVAHVDLRRIESTKHGDATTFDIGAGYVFNWNLSLYLSLGFSLGYNTDSSDFTTAYYPEVGVVLDLTNSISISANAKRYMNLYEKEEDVYMIGILFR